MEPGRILVWAKVNGLGPFPFLLDTGSTHSSMAETLAVEVGAPAVARATVGSAMGAVIRPIVRLERLDLGPISMAGVMPTVLPSEDVDPDGMVRGVIGQDVLAVWRYTIDFDERRLIWEEPLAQGSTAAATLRLERQDGRFVVTLPQERSVLRLVPDSGAEQLLLVARRDRVLPPMTLAPGFARLATLTARGLVRQGVVHELRVGNGTWRNVPAVLVENPGAERPDSDGLLPLHLFARVTFDGPRGVLIVEGRRG